MSEQLDPAQARHNMWKWKWRPIGSTANRYPKQRIDGGASALASSRISFASPGGAIPGASAGAIPEAIAGAMATVSTFTAGATSTRCEGERASSWPTHFGVTMSAAMPSTAAPTAAKHERSG